MDVPQDGAHQPLLETAGSGSGGSASVPGRGRTGSYRWFAALSPLRLWRRLGLRGRVTFMFGTGALLLSITLGCLTYFSAAHYLLSDDQNASLTKAYSAALAVKTGLTPGTGVSPTTVLSAADTASGGSSLLLYNQESYSSTVGLNQNSLPASLLKLVRSGTAATQNFVLDGSPHVAVGFPLPSVSATYFVVFDLSDLNHTLHVLALALALGGFVATVLGAVVGRAASGRSLRPLTGVSRAAVAIAGGRLDTRLPDATGDPDLAGFTSSFNLMADQIQERIEREERFSSDVSHELRSPLTTLSATLGVLEANRETLPSRAQQALELLGDDLRRFQRMVSDLLEISRSDTGSADVSLDDVDASELVKRSVDSSLRSLPSYIHAPRVEIDPELERARLRVDKRRFERVIANLLENAALYGGGATLVAAKPGPTRKDGRSTMTVEVADQGPGISPSERLHVFERFYRGQAAGRRGAGGGSGLGLALVAEHVRLNGGTVRAEEAEGGGARFVVELPMADGQELPRDDYDLIGNGNEPD